MQVKTTVRYLYTPTRVTILKKTITTVSLGVEKMRTLVHYWWENEMVQLLWEIVWQFLKRLKIELPYDPAIPLLGLYPREMKTYVHIQMFTAAFSQEPKDADNLNIHQVMHGYIKYGLSAP